MTDIHVFTIPVLLHVAGNNPQDAINRLNQAGERVQDNGPVTLRTNDGELTVLHATFPLEPTSFGGTKHEYDLDPTDPFYGDAVKMTLEPSP